MAAPDFWSNRERAQADVEEVSRLRSLINPFQRTGTRDRRFQRIASNWLRKKTIRRTARRPRKKSRPSTTAWFTSSRNSSCASFFPAKTIARMRFVTIHSGAGGTESCDWADMFLRMYQRWIERSGFKSQTVDIQQGEEVGIKSVTLLVTRRICLRTSSNRARRASAGAHLAVRCEQTAAHFIRQCRCCPGNRRYRADRNQSGRSGDRHLPQRRQRRAKREQSRNCRADCAQAKRNCGRLPGRAQPGTQSRARDENVESETLPNRSRTKNAPRSIGNTARKARSPGETKFAPTFFSRIKW